MLPGLASATTTINHLFNPATINPGDTPTYRIEIANDALVSLTEAEVTSLLQPQITIANPANITNTCGFTGVTAVPGTSDIVLTGGTIPARVGLTDGQCFFELSVTATTPGSYINNIPALVPPAEPDAVTAGYSALENGVRVSNATPANATLVVSTLLNPTGTKTFSPSPAIAADTTRLSIVLSNPNAAATLPLTTFTDTLPAGMLVANPANTSIACSGTGSSNGTLTAVAGTDTITLNGGIIGQSGNCTLGVDVVVATVAGTSQVFTNSLPVGAIGNTRGLTSPAFSRDLTVTSPITVSKTFNPDTIPAGQPSLLTIVINNQSVDNTLPITSFLDDLVGTTLSIVDTSGVAPADPSVVCDGVGAVNGSLTDGLGGVLAQGDTELLLSGAVAGQRSGANGKCTITAYVTSTTDGAHTNTIPADAVVNPAGHSSPTASDVIDVNAQLTVNKTVSVNQVAPGQWTQFTVTINNWSGAEVTNLSFRDSLPNSGGNQMVLDDSAGIPVSNSCANGIYTGVDGDAELTWTGGTIPAGVGANPGICTLVFRARLPLTATTGLVFTNQIPTWDGVNGIGGDGNGPGGQVVNTAPSPGVNVTTVDSVAARKTFSPDPIAEGQTSTLSILVRNRTLNQLTAVNLTDNLPAGLTLAANPSATNTCGGTLQAFPGDTQVILTGGTVNPRPDGSIQTQCQITVRVTGTTPGSYLNTINPADFSSSGGTIPAPVSDTLTINAGLSATKSFYPTSTASGGSSRVSINIVNHSSGELTNVMVDDDTFSAGLVIANPANASTSCGGATTLVVNPGATRAQLQGVSLPAGGNCDFGFDVTTSGAGPWSNTIPAGNITSAEGSSNSTPVSATLTASTADIGINKSFNPIIVTGGMPSLLTIDVINSSSITIHDAAFTDIFPDGIEIYPVPDASTNCQGGTVTAVPGGNSVGLVGATLLPNDICQVYVTTTSVRFLNLTNFIPAGVITSEEGYTNALGTEASLSTLQGLGLTKGFSPAYIPPGATSRLVLELVSTFDANAVSPVTLTSVSFTDPLPAGMVFAAVPNASTTCADATLTVNTVTQALTISGGTMLPGTSCLIEVDVTAGALGVYNNLIVQGAITTTQGATNEVPVAANLTVMNEPSVSKVFAPASVSVGERSTLTVTITNNDAIPLTGTTLRDTLPVGVSVYSAPSTATTCADASVLAIPGDNEIILTGATIPANASCTFSADVVASTSGVLTNTIGPGSIITDQGITNPGPANTNLTVLAPPTVSKAFNPASINTGGTSTLSIVLGNSNPDAITLTSTLVDALPGNVVVQTPNGLATDCPGAVTANPGAIQISYANGAAIPSGGCTISVDVTSAVDGSYLNTIAAGQLTTTAGHNPQPTTAPIGVGALINAAPGISKAFAPSTIDVNGITTLTLTLLNPNPTALTLNADFTDTFPAGLLIANPNNLAGSCTLGSVTATPGTGLLTYANGASIPSGNCTISVDVTSPTAGSYNNTIPAGAISTITGGTNPTPATGSLIVRAPQPPTLVKTILPGTINPGQISRLTLNLGNDNAVDATLGADLVDNLPANVSVSTPSNLATDCPGTVQTTANSLTYTNGSVIPPGGCFIAVDITSNVSGGPWINTIPAGALQTNLGNTTAPTTSNLFVNPAQPPSISKQFSPDTISSGGLSTLTVTLGNANASAATLTADLVDNLPAGLEIAAIPNIQTSAGCDLASVVATPGGATLTYLSGAPIPASGSCSISVDVTSVTLATLTNTIPVNGLQTTIGNNNVPTSSNLIVQPIPPGLSKSISPGTIRPNGVATLVITLTNNNAVAAVLTSDLSDTFPADLEVAADPNIQVSAGCSLPNVIAVAGTGSVVYQNGASIQPGGCTISVDITSSVVNTYTNTIPAGGLTTTLGNNPVPGTTQMRVTLEPVSIPTLDRWGIALLASLMVILAGYRMRRRFS
ncbi:MAG: IPTL-CTERM sorting domain-containing protein [Candidatus Thiodiazotropha sp.]